MNQRQFERHSTSLSGELHAEAADAEPVACDILDLSAGGAKVKSKRKVDPDTLKALKIGNLGPFDVQVRWSRNGHIGLKFLDDPDTMADVIMAVALYH